GPFGISELLLHDQVELWREHAQGEVTFGVFFVEPPDVDDVGNARDVTTPIAGLFDAARRLVPLQDRLDILDVLDRKVSAIAVEMGPDQNAVHHDISVTHNVPAVAVTSPLVAALMAEMLWPGLTMTYSITLD